ncbi:MAG: hypothetical protein ACYSXF_06225 [Planctomycetota bacterium]|jgi:hypothetical protein
MKRPPDDESPPVARVVLLGASNLTRGISAAVGTARLLLGGPLELFIAMGHGRSYGVRTRILGRTLPGIDECGLWEALLGGGDRPTYALVTDVGNDIAFGHELQAIGNWVERCVDRLLEVDARVVMTLLPTASLTALPHWRYQVARRVLFPMSSLSFNDALSAAEGLNERLRVLGDGRGVRLREPPRSWYRFDAIHIKRRLLPAAWAEVLDGWFDEPRAAGRLRWSPRRWWSLRRMTPQRWWLLGVPLGRVQPAGRLPDGSTVWLY